jgi:hypothetical protein
MKLWKTISILPVLIALLMPCLRLHVTEHDNKACTLKTVCNEAHSDCQACAEPVCPKKIKFFSSNSTLFIDPPLRTVSVCTFRPDEPIVFSVLLPREVLTSLRTVQLLI